MDEELYPNGLSLDEVAALAAKEDDEAKASLSEDEEGDNQSEDDSSDEVADEEEDTSEDEDEDSEGEGEEEGSKDEPKIADPDAVYEFTVEGETKRVSVKDLARLAGQEAALTKRSQSLAEHRKAVDNQGMVAAKLIERQYEKAVEKLGKFKDVDLNLLAKELPEDDYKAVRDAKAQAEAEVKFLENEAADFLKEVRANRAKALQEQGKETLKVINDPSNPLHIPNWSDDYYAELRTFAIGMKMDADMVNEIVDPAAIKIMHLALQHVKSEKSREEAKTKVKAKLAKAPKKVLSKGDNSTSNSSTNVQKLRDIAKRTGKLDDVMAYHEAMAAEKE